MSSADLLQGCLPRLVSVISRSARLRWTVGGQQQCYKYTPAQKTSCQDDISWLNTKMFDDFKFITPKGLANFWSWQ